jgi:hypothetical protein
LFPDFLTIHPKLTNHASLSDELDAGKHFSKECVWVGPHPSTLFFPFSAPVASFHGYLRAFRVFSVPIDGETYRLTAGRNGR